MRRIKRLLARGTTRPSGRTALRVIFAAAFGLTLRVGKWRHAPTAIVAGIILAASAATALAQSTERVSVATGGGQAIGSVSLTAATSADGRFVAFESAATDLVGGDTNGKTRRLRP